MSDLNCRMAEAMGWKYSKTLGWIDPNGKRRFGHPDWSTNIAPCFSEVVPFAHGHGLRLVLAQASAGDWVASFYRVDADHISPVALRQNDKLTIAICEALLAALKALEDEHG